MDDEMVAQLTGVATILSGKYALQIGVVAPCASAAEADVELRFHKRRRRAKTTASMRGT